MLQADSARVAIQAHGIRASGQAKAAGVEADVEVEVEVEVEVDANVGVTAAEERQQR